MNRDSRIEEILRTMGAESLPPDVQAMAERIANDSEKTLKRTNARTANLWRIAMKSNLTKLAVAAAILVVVGSFMFRSSGNGGGSQWWLSSRAAWGRELLTTLGTIQAVTYREQRLFVMTDGSQHLSGTWDLFYVSKDSYRRDIYDGNSLREIQWYVPDGNDMIQQGIRFDLKCYGAVRHHGSFGVENPVERIRFCVKLLDKADRFLGEQAIDGHNCVGFEIHADKYGTNPETWLDRIWFDKATRLPVRVELSGRPVTGATTMTFTTIQDRFDYAPQVPADTFIPQPPPAGFIDAHPDDLQR
jgi:hypothetical protein